MPNQLIELGLLKSGKRTIEALPTRIGRQAARLLSFLSEIAIESESLKTAEFRGQLARWQASLAAAADERSVERIIQECLVRCRAYFEQAREFFVQREKEIREVADILREAVATLAGQSSSFHQSLLDSSARLTRLNEIEDLRELKKQIAAEVGELTRIVSEKRQQDDVLYARMSKRVNQLHDRLRQTKQENLTDPLTQVGNRRSVDRAVRRALAETVDGAVILAMLDLDDFKKINDAYGHQVGDQALVQVAGWLSSEIRSGDYIGRYAGDEFVILFTHTTLPQAEIRFLQLLSNVSAAYFEHLDGSERRTVRMTLSCGIAESKPGESADELVRHADKALYVAKKRGKNCVVRWGSF